MLLQSILLVFALMGIATLVADMGYVRLSQVQMQSGVDTAALEGLRLRDAPGGDLGRRQEAGVFVTGTYTDPAGERLVGAGPDLTLTDGLTGANGSQKLSTSADPVYRPQLSMNSANVEHGDMVSGTFNAGFTGIEDSSYARNDFAPADTVSSPTASAFLVRMRRTDGRNPLDASDGTTVSTGRSLPLLFGFATTLQQAEGSDYSVRFDGITVRATAIVDGRPARRIASGRAAPFGLMRDFWSAMPDGAPVFLDVDGSGLLRSGFVAAGLYTQGPTNRIGQPLLAAGLSTAASGALYVPIYTDIAGTPRVIGFGFATVAVVSANSIRVTRIRNRMADSGASIHVVEGFSGVPELELVLAANSSLDGALLAPALVR